MAVNCYCLSFYTLLATDFFSLFLERMWFPLPFSPPKKKKNFLHPFQAIKTDWSLNSSCCLDYYSIGYPDSLITAGKIYWETQTNWVERLCEKTFPDISLSPRFFFPFLGDSGANNRERGEWNVNNWCTGGCATLSGGRESYYSPI